jgi:hypothetical protein
LPGWRTAAIRTDYDYDYYGYGIPMVTVFHEALIWSVRAGRDLGNRGNGARRPKWK